MAESTTSSKTDPSRVSFIETHRRRQIIEMAVDVIATQGYHQASLGNIAKATRVSKGVIAYYFTSKEDLMRQVMAHLLDSVGQYVRERVDRQYSVLEKLRSYVESNLEFARAQRNSQLALMDLWLNLGPQMEDGLFSATSYHNCRSHIEHILVEGRNRGEFICPDTTTMAMVIEGAIDGLAFQVVMDSQAVNLEACRTTLFELLTAGLKVPETRTADPDRNIPEKNSE